MMSPSRSFPCSPSCAYADLPVDVKPCPPSASKAPRWLPNSVHSPKTVVQFLLLYQLLSNEATEVPQVAGTPQLEDPT